MVRTLLSFGDSHTAGAEIINRHDYSCYDKSYAAYISKYYRFDYKNFSVAGCSNDWLIMEFNRVLKSIIENKKKVFVLFNFCESSRTVSHELSVKATSTKHFFPSLLSNNDEIYIDEEVKPLLPLYSQYLKSMNNKKLNHKAISQILYVQNICKKIKIPFVFHTSCHWYSGPWSSISQKNFYGHHKSYYHDNEILKQGNTYSFWGLACNHPDWKHLQKEYRWKEHYPEEYHKYWAKKLIAFIDEQKILEGYI